MTNKSIRILKKLSARLHQTPDRAYSRGPPYFVVMYDDESGCNIGYVQGMRIGGREEALQGRLSAANHHSRDAEKRESYTGFVRISGDDSEPISISQLAELLTKYSYDIESFVDAFSKSQ